MANQWIRKANLIVSTGTNGLDLSQMHFKFHTNASDQQNPNTLYVRVYNLSQQTANSLLVGEFQTVTLQAGYENGNFGMIFQGTIKQTAAGRERNVDSYVDIWAADGDEWYNFSVINRTLAAGHTPKDVLDAITQFQSENGVAPIKYADDVTGLIAGAGLGTAQAIRGKVLFGMARDYAQDWARKYKYSWSIQNGQFVLVKQDGYRPGQAVELSSSTGLIGVPEATNGGVRVRALLNPLIRIGCLVHIAQDDINRITYQQQGLTYAPATAVLATKEGYYRVMVAEFSGDTRGQEWYVDLICLAIDITSGTVAKTN